MKIIEYPDNFAIIDNKTGNIIYYSSEDLKLEEKFPDRYGPDKKYDIVEVLK